MPVNIDLSMSNDFHASSSNLGKCSIAGKDIEVIDLENETEHVGRGFNNSERSDMNENVFPCLDGYSNNTHNGNDCPDVQDGYGLMISEFLGMTYQVVLLCLPIGVRCTVIWAFMVESGLYRFAGSCRIF